MLLYFFYTFIYVDNFNAFMPTWGPLLNFSHKEVSKAGEGCVTQQEGDAGARPRCVQALWQLHLWLPGAHPGLSEASRALD